MILTRKHNWPELLNHHLDVCSKRLFHYGIHDCCYFASNTIKRLTVEALDIASAFDNYSTKIGALRALKKFGCESVEAFVEKTTLQYAIPEIIPSIAQRGDIVLGIDEESSTAVGICVGTHAAFADDGLRFIPMQNILRAWHYG